VEGRLPALLSVIAGMVNAIGFLSLGFFTAHVTGNLVVIAALLGRGGPPKIAQVLAVPVFITSVGAVWLIAKSSALVRPLLLVRFLLLTCVLTFSVINDPAVNPHRLMAIFVAMVAVSAMACQFALLRLAMPGAPSTAVMTGNLTSSVLSLLDGLSRNQPLMGGPGERWRKALMLVGGFFTGGVTGRQQFLYSEIGLGPSRSCWPRRQSPYTMATADVVVRSATGGEYLCDRELDRSGWRCGRCERGVLVPPRIGSPCPVCQAEVIAVRSQRSGVSFVLVLATLILGWLVLAWWR
jgi:uncharacterized membrane protein YoaK (UPF0700 family)